MNQVRVMLEQEKLQGRLSRLKNASEGLFYPSDVDEPFTVFNWKVRDEPPLEKERVREILQLSAHDPIQVKKLDDLFGRLTTPQEWHTDEDLDVVEQFQ
ncbi:MAG: nuclease A inhibitor family protein, partial [Bacteroidota bacterium]